MECTEQKQKRLPSMFSFGASSPAPICLSGLGRAVRWAAWLWTIPHLSRVLKIALLYKGLNLLPWSPSMVPHYSPKRALQASLA